MQGTFFPFSSVIWEVFRLCLMVLMLNLYLGF